jgi:hypothetical protein
MKIGFGIFCFGDEYYYNGAYEKALKILESDYECYILTENIDYFSGIDKLNVIPYYRSYKSYHDKLKLPKYILKDCDICILIDADLEIKDYSFLDDLRHFKFKEGISYIDVLLNHQERKNSVRELNLYCTEWDEYRKYCEKVCPDFQDLALIWEYFLVINRDGFNSNFYLHYEKLQIKKESCHLFDLQKDVIAPGEGVSISIASILSKTRLQRDIDLYNLIKDNVFSFSKRFYCPRCGNI